MNAVQSATEHSYTWGFKYTKSVASGGHVVHDLLTVSSLDSGQYQTLEAVYTPSLAAPMDDYYSVTAAGLRISGQGTSSTDTLFLTGGGLYLDLTNLNTKVTYMDKFNISGTGDNTIKIDLNTLVQADTVNGHHTLYIVGDSGDKVVIAGAGLASAWTHANNQAGDTVYTNAGTNDQLVIDAHITAANISFVAT
jgi:hypothetical protein